MFNLFNRFFKNETPDNLKYQIGQKVLCMVTNEVPGSQVTPGTILKFVFKKKSYWAFSDTPSNWYLVKYKDGKKISLPEERLQDLQEYIKRDKEMREFYTKMGSKPGDKGWSFEVEAQIKKQNKEISEFI